MKKKLSIIALTLIPIITPAASINNIEDYISSLQSKLYPNMNKPPKLNLNSVYKTNNKNITIDLNPIDEDINTLTYSIFTTDNGINYTIENNKLNISFSSPKKITLYITAKDKEGLTSKTYPINVIYSTQQSTPPTLEVDKNSLTFNDNNPQYIEINSSTNNIVLSSSNNLINAILNNNTIKITRNTLSSGESNLTITAINQDGGITTKTINITLNSIPKPYIVLSTNNLNLYQKTFDKNISFSSNSSNFSCNSDTLNCDIDENNKVIEISGTDIENGNYDLTISNNEVSTKLKVNVNYTNFPPTIILPTNQVNIPQSNMITQNVIIEDKNNNLKTVDIELLKNDEIVEQNQTNYNNNYKLTLQNENLKIKLENNTLNITALKYSPTPYTIKIKATDNENSSTQKELTINLQKIDPQTINNLVPVKIVDVNNQCKEQYQYTNDNLSNFKISYNPNEDSIIFDNFNYNNHDFSDITLNYDNEYAMYGGKDSTYAAAIKLGIEKEGQFSNGKVLCIAPENNVSNQTCWALATPKQAENIKNSCPNAVYSNQ